MTRELLFSIRPVANGFVTIVAPPNVPAELWDTRVAQSLDELACLARQFGQEQLEAGVVVLPSPAAGMDVEAMRQAALSVLVARGGMGRRPRGEGGAQLELAIEGLRVAVGASPQPSPSAVAVGEGEDEDEEDEPPEINDVSRVAGELPHEGDLL